MRFTLPCTNAHENRTKYRMCKRAFTVVVMKSSLLAWFSVSRNIPANLFLIERILHQNGVLMFRANRTKGPGLFSCKTHAVGSDIISGKGISLMA